MKIDPKIKKPIYDLRNLIDPRLKEQMKNSKDRSKIRKTDLGFEKQIKDSRNRSRIQKTDPEFEKQIAKFLLKQDLQNRFMA